MSKSLYRKMCSCSPGGRDCSCCFPPSGTKSRRAVTRAAERAVRRHSKDELRYELDSFPNSPTDTRQEYGLGYMQGRGAA